MNDASSPLSKPSSDRVLIVDDHPLVRRGLAELIGQELNLEVCGQAAEAAEALQQVKQLAPELVIVDISLKSGHGIELIKQIKAHNDQIKMLVSSMHDETVYAERALRAGAMGYINKQEPPDRLIMAIQDVLNGKIYLSQRMTEHMLHRAVDGGDPADQRSTDRLTDRELEVFEMIGRGKTTREIAEDLHLSIKTVETHREHIKTKLQLKTPAELARHAVQWVLEKD